LLFVHKYLSRDDLVPILTVKDPFVNVCFLNKHRLGEPFLGIFGKYMPKIIAV